MEEEHCGVDPQKADSEMWGASNRPWKTGNYGIETTPRLEWCWSRNLEWNGQEVKETIGGYEKEGWDFTGRENVQLRRKAMSIQALHAEAPKRIHTMLVELAQSRGGAFADADGDGNVDEADMLTEAEVKELYSDTNINEAELLGLRLYTGPMFEFYNNVLRARGGTVPFGARYCGTLSRLQVYGCDFVVVVQVSWA